LEVLALLYIFDLSKARLDGFLTVDPISSLENYPSDGLIDS